MVRGPSSSSPLLQAMSSRAWSEMSPFQRRNTTMACSGLGDQLPDETMMPAMEPFVHELSSPSRWQAKSVPVAFGVARSKPSR
jgi:hypothetical protein